MGEPKRKRTVNFSFEETDLLITLVQEGQSVIENKRTDAVTWKEKEAKWEELTSIFNSKNIGPHRNTASLRSKYECLKKKTRKEYSETKKELKKTGGGKMATNNDLDPLSERIGVLMGVSLTGCSSYFDSDSGRDVEIEATSIEFAETELIDMPSFSGDEGKKTPTGATCTEITQDNDEIIEEEILPNNKCPTDHIYWGKWTPQALKTPTNPVLLKKSTELNGSTNEEYRPTTSAAKKFGMLSGKKLIYPSAARRTNEKFSNLADAKMEVVHLQKAVLEEELKQKLIHGKIQCQILDTELQIKQAELKIKLKELNKL